jgi:sugar lactone lactonase YvrE
LITLPWEGSERGLGICGGRSHPPTHTGLAVDATGNVYVADTFNNLVKQIPHSGGIYGTPVIVGSGFNNPTGVAVDAQGRLYAIDSNYVWIFTP